MTTNYASYASQEILNSVSSKDGTTEKQLRVANEVCSGTQILDTSLQKGNLGEILEDLLIIGAGFLAMHTRISTIDARTHLGLDGVYYTQRKGYELYIVADAKFGSARLSTTRSGRQLSDAWIDYRLVTKTLTTTETPTRLEAAIGRTNADSAVRKIISGQATLIRLLTHVSPDYTVTLSIVDSNGFVAQRGVSFKEIEKIANGPQDTLVTP